MPATGDKEPVTLTSADPTAERVAQLRKLFPECYADGRIDFDKLRAALGDAVASGPERFTFSWAGRADAANVLQTPSRATLVPKPNESVNWDTTRNLFIEGDNLEVLKLLYKAYAGKVKLIYIDPPYNTGNDFVYPDDFADPLAVYLKLTKQADDAGNLLTSNPETSGRYHSAWLSMMHPRLFLARQLLRDDGVIFVSIDDHEVANLRLLMNEVFGEENFVAQIILQSNARGRQSERFAATVHEYLIAFAKESELCEVKGAELTMTQLAEFKYTDANNRKYRLRGLRHRGNASRREDRPQMFFPLYVNPNDQTVSLDKTPSHSVEVLPRKSTGEDGRWEWGKATTEQRLGLLEGVLIGTRNEWDVYQRDYLEEGGEERRRKWVTIWAEKEIDYQNAKRDLEKHVDAARFEFPKPVYLLKKIIAGATDDESVVLDFFGGSCTTAQAVLELNREDGGNRRFVMVQLPEPTGNKQYPTIAEIGKERIRRVIAKLKKEPANLTRTTPEDLGFKVFALAESHFKQWAGVPERDAAKYAVTMENYLDPLMPNANPVAVLWELAVKEGYGLNSTIAAAEVGKNSV